MEELAQVIENDGDTALVQITRHSACSKCDHKCGLAQNSSHESDQLEIEVKNDAGADKGQLVSLEMNIQPLVKASLIVYLIPLIGLIGGYFFGIAAADNLGFQANEMTGIIGSLSFLILSFGIIRLIDNRLGIKKEYHPRITKILE